MSAFEDVLHPHSFFIMHAVVLQAVLFSLHWQTEVNVTLYIPKELLPLMKLTVKVTLLAVYSAFTYL